MDIKITGVHHIMISVGDLETSKHFYGYVLGLVEKEIPPGIEGERVWYHLGPLQLHVNVHPKYRDGFDHFAITIENGKYDEYIKRVRETGYEKISDTNTFVDGMTRTYIDDPFGNSIEIIDGQVGD